MNSLRKTHRGFSLPELMVAILLGTIITTAVIGMYLSTSKNFRQDENYALMQENGRYALTALSNDFAMADFWGTMTANFSLTGPALGVSGDCADGDPAVSFGASDGPGLYEGSTGLLYNNANNTPRFQLDSGCIAVYDDQRANTNLLVIKRTLGVPENYVVATNDCDRTVAGVAGITRLRTNGTDGSFVNDTTVPGAGFCDWRYAPRIYFVRDFFDTVGDGIPSLCRLDLIDNGGTPGMGALTNYTTGAGTLDGVTCIAEGIEHVHVMFGIDTDGDGVANRYNSSPTMVVAAGDAEMEGVVSARIYILARTNDADPAYSDAKTFVLGDLNVAAANDGFYRRVFSTTVMVRNSVNLNLLNN